jgi:hypothetical protein
MGVGPYLSDPGLALRARISSEHGEQECSAWEGARQVTGGVHSHATREGRGDDGGDAHACLSVTHGEGHGIDRQRTSARKESDLDGFHVLGPGAGLEGPPRPRRASVRPPSAPSLRKRRGGTRNPSRSEGIDVAHRPRGTGMQPRTEVRRRPHRTAAAHCSAPPMARARRGVDRPRRAARHGPPGRGASLAGRQWQGPCQGSREGCKTAPSVIRGPCRGPCGPLPGDSERNRTLRRVPPA